MNSQEEKKGEEEAEIRREMVRNVAHFDNGIHGFTQQYL